MAKRTKKGKGKTKTRVGIKEPNQREREGPKKPVGKPPKMIKMLMSLANQHRAYTCGSVYRVPHDVPVDTARSWVASGAAEDVSPKKEPGKIEIISPEEDMSLKDVPEETKKDEITPEDSPD